MFVVNFTYIDPGFPGVVVFLSWFLLRILRFVRLKALRQVHPDRPIAASFSTDSYGITADLELDHESVQLDGKQAGSRVFQAYLQSRKKETATLHVLGGSVSNQPGYLACTHLKEVSHEVAALDSICLVFYRTEFEGQV